jgi:hypothetical protein
MCMPNSSQNFPLPFRTFSQIFNVQAADEYEYGYAWKCVEKLSKALCSYFGSILLRAIKSKIIVLLINVYKK